MKEKLLNDFIDKRGENYLVPRWTTYWYQFHLICKLNDIKTILEIGPGRGLFGAICKHFNYVHKSIDIVENPNANYQGNIVSFKFNHKFDATCAFQVLEHNRFHEIPKLISALCTNSKKYVIITLPVSKRWLGFTFDFNIPFLKKHIIGGLDLGRLLFRKRDVSKYDLKNSFNYHWWELYEKKCYFEELNKYFNDNKFSLKTKLRVKSYRYHIALVYEKNPNT